MYIYQIMSNNFGYIDIILLGMIAGFIILRLRSILGRKTGHEPKIYPNFADRKFEVPNNEPTEIKLNHDKLEGKDKKEFLKGAEIAYETILTSFAAGDTNKLKSLLTRDMSDNFEQAIKLSQKINAKKTVLTNLHSDLDYNYLKKVLPKNIVPAYDGMVLKL